MISNKWANKSREYRKCIRITYGNNKKKVKPVVTVYYRRNRNTPAFYQNLSNIVTKLPKGGVVVGYFNLELDTTQDYVDYLHAN